MGADKRTVTVTIDEGSEPVSGTVHGPGEAPVEFAGYMQLVAQLERHHHPEGATEEHPIGEARDPG